MARVSHVHTVTDVSCQACAHCDRCIVSQVTKFSILTSVSRISQVDASQEECERRGRQLSELEGERSAWHEERQHIHAKLGRERDDVTKHAHTITVLHTELAAVQQQVGAAAHPITVLHTAGSRAAAGGCSSTPYHGAAHSWQSCSSRWVQQHTPSRCCTQSRQPCSSTPYHGAAYRTGSRAATAHTITVLHTELAAVQQQVCAVAHTITVRHTACSRAAAGWCRSTHHHGTAHGAGSRAAAHTTVLHMELAAVQKETSSRCFTRSWQPRSSTHHQGAAHGAGSSI